MTIDGVGELNDRRRLHRDGVPTYDRILKNVALALEHGVDISLRVNVNGDNIGGIKALIDDLTARGLHEASREERIQADKEAREAEKAGKPRPKRKGFFSYYFKAVSEDRNSPTKVTEQQVMDAIIAAGIPPMDAIEKQSQYSMPMQGLYAAMKKEDFPSFSPAFCGSEQGMLVIGPDGLIYPCWDLVAMEEDAVGFTDEATGRFFFNFGKAKWRGAAARRKRNGYMAVISVKTAAKQRRFSHLWRPGLWGLSGKKPERMNFPYRWQGRSPG